MNKTQLIYLLEKVSRGESAADIVEGIEKDREVAIESVHGSIVIKSQAHLDAIMQILTEISEEGKRALERAKLE